MSIGTEVIKEKAKQIRKNIDDMSDEELTLLVKNLDKDLGYLSMNMVDKRYAHSRLDKVIENCKKIGTY